jgi:ankyrin repeat protein
VRFLFLDGVLGAESNAGPSDTQQKILDEKLMNTLSFGPRGHCDLKAVQGLLQQGASPNARNEDGNTLTALMVAAGNGCSDIVKLLLDAGAKVNAKASYVSGAEANVLDGITPLWERPRLKMQRL